MCVRGLNYTFSHTANSITARCSMLSECTPAPSSNLKESLFVPRLLQETSLRYTHQPKEQKEPARGEAHLKLYL